jgi:FG-GAP-like repeat
MKRKNSPNLMVIVGFASGSLFLPLAIESVPAVTVPDIRGTWTYGFTSSSVTGCQDPADNGSFNDPGGGIFHITNQTGRNFSVNKVETVIDGGFTVPVTETCSGTVSSNGTGSASCTYVVTLYGEVWYSGTSRVSGTIIGNTITATETGQDLVGDTCQWTATGTITRSSTIPPPIAVGMNVPHDFDGNGMDDIVWRNMSSTVVAVWLMNGTTIASTGFLGGVPAEWQIHGIGDVDGDGKVDVIWKQSSLNVIAIWLMNGLTIHLVGFPGGVSSDWEIEEVGDVNGDGKADLVWRNVNSGVVAIWLMNGTAITAPGFLEGVPAEWQIRGLGDVNGDEKADVIWHHAITGTVAVSIMDGLNITSVGFPGSTSTDWKIEGVGDFNGDGKADLIWKNDTSDIVAIWLMNGVSIASSGVLGGIPPALKIEQVGDMNGDGKADVVLMNSTTAEVTVWLMDGLTVVGIGSPGIVPIDWEIQP